MRIDPSVLKTWLETSGTVMERAQAALATPNADAARLMPLRLVVASGSEAAIRIAFEGLPARANVAHDINLHGLRSGGFSSRPGNDFEPLPFAKETSQAVKQAAFGVVADYPSMRVAVTDALRSPWFTPERYASQCLSDTQRVHVLESLRPVDDPRCPRVAPMPHPITRISNLSSSLQYTGDLLRAVGASHARPDSTPPAFELRVLDQLVNNLEDPTLKARLQEAAALAGIWIMQDLSDQIRTFQAVAKGGGSEVLGPRNPTLQPFLLLEASGFAERAFAKANDAMARGDVASARSLFSFASFNGMHEVAHLKAFEASVINDVTRGAWANASGTLTTLFATAGAAATRLREIITEAYRASASSLTIDRATLEGLGAQGATALLAEGLKQLGTSRADGSIIIAVPAPSPVDYRTLIANGESIVPPALKDTLRDLRALRANADGSIPPGVRLKTLERALLAKADAAMEQFRHALLERKNVHGAMELACGVAMYGIPATCDALHLRSGLADIYRLVGPRALTYVESLTFGKESAATEAFGHVIEMGRPATLSAARTALFHEFGHKLEDNDRPLRDALGDWLDSRATTGLIPWHEIRPGSSAPPSAMGRRGRFINDYVGRVYPPPDPRKTPPGKVPYGGGEVLSMGLQHFATASAMVDLMASDEEHFYLTLGALSR